MSGPVIWVDGVFDRKLTPEELEAAEGAIADSEFADFANDAGWLDYEFYDTGFYFGWIYSPDGERFCDFLANLVPGVSCTVEVDWHAWDEPGKSTSFYGPRALELEIKHIENEIASLNDRLLNLRKQAAEAETAG